MIGIQSGENSVVFNNFIYKQGVGLDITGAWNDVTRNTVEDCNTGIRILSSDNSILRNTILTNSVYGLRILSVSATNKLGLYISNHSPNVSL